MSKKFYNIINKIHAACDTGDDVNQCYGYVYFRDGYAYASNGRILVRTPLSELLQLVVEQGNGDPEYLNGFCVHARTLKRIMGHDEIQLTPGGIIIAKDKNTTVTYQLPLEGMEGAPKGPSFENILTPPEQRHPIKNIGLNARYLATLAEAMGVRDNIRMRFTTANRVIFIDPTDETNHSIGVIMPIILQASLPGFDDDETEEGYNDESTNQ